MIIAWLVGGSFLLVGLLVLRNGFQLSKQALQSHSWPRCKAMVVQSEISVAQQPDEDNLWLFLYRYEVASVEYHGSRLELACDNRTYLSGTVAELQALCERYPAGAQIDIRHKPNDPEISCVAPGMTARGRAQFGLGTLLLVAGAAILALAWF
jgi:hypothetical protein